MADMLQQMILNILSSCSKNIKYPIYLNFIGGKPHVSVLAQHITSNLLRICGLKWMCHYTSISDRMSFC